jgi:hypothetical protein
MIKKLNFCPEPYPVTNVFFIDYKPSKNCCNDDSYGTVCVKCGKCGRKFIDGVLQEGKQ